LKFAVFKGGGVSKIGDSDVIGDIILGCKSESTCMFGNFVTLDGGSERSEIAAKLAGDSKRSAMATLGFGDSERGSAMAKLDGLGDSASPGLAKLDGGSESPGMEARNWTMGAIFYV